LFDHTDFTLAIEVANAERKAGRWWFLTTLLQLPYDFLHRFARIPKPEKLFLPICDATLSKQSVF